MSDVKRLLSVATPLPWNAPNPDWPEKALPILNDSAATVALAWASEFEVRKADAELIVYAVNRLPDYEAAVDAAAAVMWTLERFGPSIVPHLMDTDQNAGERLRMALARLRERVPA